jgi:hypothetical protein
MPNSHKKFELSPRLKFGVGRGYSQNQILKFSSILFLILAVGLTFNAFRLILGRHSQANMATSAAAPQVLGASDIKTSTDSGDMQFTEYKVQKGDTLFNVSQNFNIGWTTLATLNNLKSPFALKPGQILKIPR